MIVGAITLMVLAALLAFAAVVVAAGGGLKMGQDESGENLLRLALALLVVTFMLVFAGSAILVSQ